ncbi:MAG: hypothetical protein QM831_44455 [Kofleriaceae bacterium]
MRIIASLVMLSACTSDPYDHEPTPQPTPQPQPAPPPPSTPSCPDISTIDGIELVYFNDSITDPVIATGGTATFYVQLHDRQYGTTWTPFPIDVRSDSTIVSQPQDTYSEIDVHPKTAKTDIEAYEPCSGKLLGTAFITAAPIDHVTITGFGDTPLTQSDQPQYAVLMLVGADGHALQDESAHLTSPDNISQFFVWDLIAYGGLTPGAHAFTVTSNNVAYPGSLTIE